MADVTLAECGGGCWLVDGEPHLDDLLMNSLASDIEVAVISCASVSEVSALWVLNGGRPDEGEQPWKIHPKILARVRNSNGGDHVVSFQPWSALIDAAAQAVIAVVAHHAEGDAALAVVLVDTLGADADASLVALNALRGTLLRRSLADHGVAVDRLRGRSRGDGVAGDAGEDKITIVLEPLVAEPPAGTV